MPEFTIDYKQTEFRRCTVTAATEEEALSVFREKGGKNDRFLGTDIDQEVLDITGQPMTKVLVNLHYIGSNELGSPYDYAEIPLTSELWDQITRWRAALHELGVDCIEKVLPLPAFCTGDDENDDDLEFCGLRLVLEDDGFWWSAYIQDVPDYVETYRIPYNLDLTQDVLDLRDYKED